MTLVEFLLARIAEDEDAARRAGSSAWLHRSLYRHLGSRQSVYAEDREVAEVEHTDGWHIARWDPSRVLVECDAKRRIVAEHAPTERDPAEKEMAPGYCRMCVGENGWPLKEGQVGVGVKAPCRTLRLLAAPYGDHPDYRSNWKA